MVLLLAVLKERFDKNNISFFEALTEKALF
jgi:hypothetical protein